MRGFKPGATKTKATSPAREDAESDREIIRCGNGDIRVHAVVERMQRVAENPGAAAELARAR